MIEFGMPTLIECPALEQSVSLCKELGLQFIEINTNLPHYQLEALDVRGIKKALEDSGLYLTVHLDENLNVCDFNTGVARAYLDTVLRMIGVARELDIPILNMHMPVGVHFTLPDRKEYLFDRYKAWYFERLHEFRGLCDEAIADADITVCIENCGAHKSFERAGVELLLESERFALTYDIGHDRCARDANEQFILQQGAKLKHMHVHDATSDRNHLALGDGDIDIVSKLRLAGERNCRCVLETKTADALRQSVKKLDSYEL